MSPILTHEALVWWDSLGKLSYKRSIDKVQRVTDAFRSALQAGLEFLHFKYIVEEQAVGCSLRFKELKIWH